jgi:hypothetical protein
VANATLMSHVCPDNPPIPIRPVARSFVSRLVIGAINPHHAFNPAYHAPNGCADNGADRTSTAVAFIRAVGNAAGYSLSLRCDRHRDDCKNRGRNKNS